MSREDADDDAEEGEARVDGWRASASCDCDEDGGWRERRRRACSVLKACKGKKSKGARTSRADSVRGSPPWGPRGQSTSWVAGKEKGASSPSSSSWFSSSFFVVGRTGKLTCAKTLFCGCLAAVVALPFTPGLPLPPSSQHDEVSSSSSSWGK